MCSGMSLLHFHGIRQNNNNVSLNVAGVTRIIKKKGSGDVESDWGQGIIFLGGLERPCFKRQHLSRDSKE